MVTQDTFLKEYLEVFKPFVVRNWISLHLILDKFKNSSCDNISKFCDEAAILVSLPRDIEWQIFTVDDTLDEPQVSWDELRAVFFDQNFARVEVHLHLFLDHLHLLCVVVGDVENGPDGKWDICCVMELVLVWDLSVG